MKERVVQRLIQSSDDETGREMGREGEKSVE